MKDDTRTFYQQAVAHTLELIAAHLDQALDLETLARAAGLSPFHFHRVFRGMIGETPLDLARRLRLERAAQRLTDTDAPVTEIAFDAGYETHEAFTRAFRACYSTSPSGFRRRSFPRIELAATCGVHYRFNGSVAPFIARDTGGQHMQVEITLMPELRVGAVRHVGPYNQIPLAFERLGAIAAAAGLFERAATLVAIYHDDPDATPQEQLRADAAITLPEQAPLPAGMAELRLPAGRYARAVHRGPYEQLGDTWARFMGEWLPASGHRMTDDGLSYEIYRNTPMQVPKDQLLTELYLPLAG